MLRIFVRLEEMERRLSALEQRRRTSNGSDEPQA
jgi:hypothetical protein